MTVALRQMMRLGQREWVRSLLVMVAIGAAVGWAGPFGSALGQPLIVRLTYWMLAIPLIGVIASISIRTVAGSEPGSSWPLAVQALVGALIAGLPGTVIATGLDTMFDYGEGAHVGFSLVHLATQYLSVTILVAAIGIPWNIINSLRGRTVGESSPAAPGPDHPGSAALSSPFLQRIPPRLGQELLYISAEDHYLRVTTKLGSELLLFRFSDAIAELGQALGRQVHRSHWVARSAVAEVKRQDGRVSLLLTDGSQIPVSKTYVASLREVGWLSDGPHPGG